MTRALLLAVSTAALVAGCGIRATEGPVNAGEPAKRPSPQGTTPSGVVGRHQIYLVRDGRPQPVLRGDPVDIQIPQPGSTKVPVPDDPQRMSQIDRLLRELVKGPSADERAQGWTTALPSGGVGPAEPQPGDPADLVRLDVEPSSLSPLGLGQVVCTLQHASHAEVVPLAGRLGLGKPMRCGDFLAGPVPGVGKSPMPPTR
ncbi:hypothetical protein [Yinghuangia seranimata]|uniref:hypothetical protein n=1 Tax=Yinghuangia seranimata TaxID=408067 RepID=UPI00248B2072|nr:hypothetical protein [Yinghuangia seranimata]MDI2130959.1 hypothetical protein [Yinghuangia seranimata]